MLGEFKNIYKKEKQHLHIIEMTSTLICIVMKSLSVLCDLVSKWLNGYDKRSFEDCQ